MSASTARYAAIGALVAASAVLLFFVLGGSDSGNRFSVVVPAAANLVPGQPVNAGGQKIGSVTGLEPVDGGRSARIKLRIDDDDYWPLGTDTKLEIRFGGTVSFSNRYLLLTRGKRRDQLIQENGELATANVQIPVEVDEFVADFTAPLRRDIKRLINNSAEVFDRSDSDLQQALRKAPPVTVGASALVADLTSNERQLETLVASTGKVVDALDSSSPDLGVLLQGAAQTFDAIAAESDDLGTSLKQFPAALRQTRTTLAKADTTLRDAGRLTDRIGPGVEELRKMTKPLNATLASVRAVTPEARALLKISPRDGRIAGDVLNAIADNGKRIGSIGKQATKEVGCLRPWAPEIVMLGTTWADWMSPIDKRDHIVRATVQNFLPAQYNSVPITPGQAAKYYKGLDYGMPRPPGALAGQPWFQPQCGVGPDAVNPDKDQEGKQFAENQLPPELRPTSSLKGGAR